ncbi:hypothetical protein NIES4106_01040 [Fischerella sp. NIES-4106]|jgi:hypothetical protein|nr:hypothetical protein NIES4106_01040 [Fischerella sp. NIES-4106]
MGDKEECLIPTTNKFWSQLRETIEAEYLREKNL